MVLPGVPFVFLEEAVVAGEFTGPLLFVLKIAKERETFERGEDDGENPLGGGDVVDAAAVTECDAGGQPGGDPVDAGHHGLDDLNTAKPFEGVDGVFADKGEDPEIDVVGRGGVARDADDVGFGREVVEELGGECVVDADAEHRPVCLENVVWVNGIVRPCGCLLSW